MKHHALLIICLSVFSLVHAQSKSVQTYNTDKALQFYIGLGGTYNDFKNLNTAFKDAGLPTVGKFTLASVIEADIRFKNLLVGLNGSMGFSYKRPDDYNSYLLNLGQQLNIGYYIFNNKSFHLAPQVGIGFLSSAVNIVQRENIHDFNELITNGNSISINQNAAILDFCLRFDFADFTKPKAPAGSVKLGYKYGLSNRGWGIDITNNSIVNNSPEDRINQFYITFSAGVSLLKPDHSR